MKKIIFSAAVALLLLGACKTNENNYRDAYLKAKDKQTETGDSLTTAALRQSDLPKDMTIDGVTLPVMTFPVTLAEKQTGAEMRRYFVVVGRFRQIFNARSMSERLATEGYAESFVLRNRKEEYFVVAAAANTPQEAHEILTRLRADKNVVLRAPYPYVLRPAHLVR